MWSVEESDQRRGPRRRRAALARWPSISSSICVLIALRASGRSSRSSATPVGDVVGGQRVSSSTRTPRRRRSSRPGARSRRPRASISSADLVLGLGEARRGRRRRRSRGRSSRAARRRPARARSRSRRGRCARLLSPLWPATPAAELGADLAERQVDLVVDDDHPLERHPQRAARRAGGVARLVHVGLRRCRTATRGPPGPARPSAIRPR